MDKIIKLGVVGSILLVAVAIFYYLVIYIPQKDKQKIDQEKKQAEQKVLQQNLEKETRQTALSFCLDQTEESYHDNWNNECKSQGKLSQACISLLDMTFEDYVKENNISDDERVGAISKFYNKRSDCSCRLPLDNSDRIDGWRKEAKDECYKKYPN